MFTGIITDTTEVISSKQDKSGLLITFAKPREWHYLERGESIATNGVCLTVAAIRATEYDCRLMPETLSKTSFGATVPKQVNLERALKVSDRLSGHFVQGHVDGIGHITRIDKTVGTDLFVSFNPSDAPLVVYKGSVTINGVSLTVAEVSDNELKVSLVPYTLEHTTLNLLKPEDAVNLEFDIIGKYVHKSLQGVPDYATGKTR